MRRALLAAVGVSCALAAIPWDARGYDGSYCPFESHGCAPYGYGGLCGGWSSFGIRVGGVGTFSYYHGPVGGPPIWGLPGHGLPYRMSYPFGPNGYVYGPSLDPPPLWDPAIAGGAGAWAPADGNLPGDAPLDVVPQGDPSPLLTQDPSSAAAKLRSVRAQSDGDMWFRRQEYHKAYDRYKAAIAAAGDRAEPRYRLALTFAALGHFGPAVRELKLALQRDPAIPARGETLDAVFGEDNGLAKSAMIGRVTRWVREDIRDPDRLFLIGSLLYLDQDRERAQPFFEAAWKVAGEGDHILAFLQPRQEAPAGDVEDVPEAAGDALVPPLQGEGGGRADQLPQPDASGNVAPTDGGDEEGPALPPLPTP